MASFAWRMKSKLLMWLARPSMIWPCLPLQRLAHHVLPLLQQHWLPSVSSVGQVLPYHRTFTFAISSAGASLPLALWRASSLTFKIFQTSLLQRPSLATLFERVPTSPYSLSHSLQGTHHSLKLPWCLLTCLGPPFPTQVLSKCLPFLWPFCIGCDGWHKISEKLKILANCREAFSIASIDTNPEVVHRDTVTAP